MSIKEIVVPDIGDFDSVEVIEVLVAEGDVVQVEDSLITVESDKASMEIPSSESGKIVKIRVALGDDISEGSVIVMMDVDDSAKPSSSEKEQSSPAPSKKDQAEPAHEKIGAG